MIKLKLLLLLIYSFILLKADGQTNPLPLRQVERINSTNYSIHIEKNEPLNLNALRESELNKLFSTNWNKLPKFKPSSFWFYHMFSFRPGCPQSYLLYIFEIWESLGHSAVSTIYSASFYLLNQASSIYSDFYLFLLNPYLFGSFT